MRRDTVGPLIVLVFCLVYGALALNIEMFPGQENEAFTPRTLPLGLTGLGIVLALILIVQSHRAGGGPGVAEMVRGLDWGRTVILVVLMSLYGLVITPLGFILSTILFLLAGFFTLGERRPLVLLLAAVPIVVVFWALMTRGLGVYLEPGRLPELLGL
jgi:putative tricarboxylic transport membrane protein